MLTLADKLDRIALHYSWYGDALADAHEHPAVSFTDKFVLRRYMHGIDKGMDYVTLQQIANKIRAYEAED